MAANIPGIPPLNHFVHVAVIWVGGFHGSEDSIWGLLGCDTL